MKAFLVEHPDVTAKLLEGIQAAVPETVVPTRKATEPRGRSSCRRRRSADAADDNAAAKSNGASLAPVE